MPAGSPNHRRKFSAIAARPAVLVIICIAAINLFASPPVTASERLASIRIDLAGQQPGTPPRDFKFWPSEQPHSSRWRIVGDTTANGGASIQESGADNTAPSALAVYDSLATANVRINARFKLMGGSMASAGFAVRVTSPGDYYLVRVSASEQRLSLIHVVAGVFEELSSVEADIALNHWQTLEVAAESDRFTISLDDQWALTVFDRSVAAIGQVALWTERDDVTRFDQVQITPLTVTTN